MRGTDAKSIWAFLLAVFLAVGTAVLPGCSDDNLNDGHSDDTGIDSVHPDFAGRLLPGFDFWNGDSDPEDDHSHGTHVTGLLAANADNAFAVAGVDHFCSILPVKIFGE